MRLACTGATAPVKLRERRRWWPPPPRTSRPPTRIPRARRDGTARREIPARLRESAHGGFAAQRFRGHYDDIIDQLQSSQRYIQVGRIRCRMREHIRRHGTETQPASLFSHALPVLCIERRQQEQAPFAVPARRRLTIDSVRRLLEAFAALLRKAVETAPPNLLRLQPAVLRQPKHRSAYKSLADAELAHRLDQATKPYNATARSYGVTKYGCDQ